MKCLFIIQGEGRGHMTQALALRRMLRRAGHAVCAAVLGRNEQRAVPDFVLEKMDAPLSFVKSPTFTPDDDRRGIHLPATLWRGLRHLPTLPAALETIGDRIEQHQPDVVVNFFEPMAGLFYARYRPRVPMVAIGHQYMFLHPAYRFPPGQVLHRWTTRAFAQLTAWGATQRLALSLEPMPARPGLIVMPPLLRDAVFDQPVDRRAPFLLVYVLNAGYASDIVAWHRTRPEVPLHCFWDRPDAAPVEPFDETLTFHRLDDAKFLSMMARAQGLATTAGFESMAEARYLGTPMQAVPVAGHFEQRCNAWDAERAGAGCRSRRFDLDHLLHFQEQYAAPPSSYHRWVESAETRFVAALEAAVRGTRTVVAPGVPGRDHEFASGDGAVVSIDASPAQTERNTST